MVTLLKAAEHQRDRQPGDQDSFSHETLQVRVTNRDWQPEPEPGNLEPGNLEPGNWNPATWNIRVRSRRHA
jgi:hypothetical protein